MSTYCYITYTLKNESRISTEISGNGATVTKGQLGSMEEISYSSNDLSKIAQELQEIINQFKI